ncbi:MAG: esterase-like activity of phytase family protein [Planctomycetota bacterium]
MSHTTHSSLGLLLLSAALAPTTSAQGTTVRFATYNSFLNRANSGDLIAELSGPGSPQIAAVAEVLQRTRPDVILLNEFDFDAGRQALDLFRQNYLAAAQNGAAPIDYPYVFLAPSNTGLPSGFDLDNNGVVGTAVGTADYANDCFGFGFFPGQFGMVLMSRFPIATADVRTFQQFLWADMPGALLPDDPSTSAPGDWYSPAELQAVRLSSKSHWDVPVLIDGRRVHMLCAHPTPPVFDGPEDRNGRRNHDEIRFWADYVTPGAGTYIRDDAGVTGGLAVGERFVVVGDYNADPTDGDGVPGAMQQLLRNARVRDTYPTSRGGFESSLLEGGANLAHVGSPALDTGNFTDVSAFFAPSGNLRTDYVLPSRNLIVDASGVFWPGEHDAYFSLVGFGDPTNGNAVTSSDHRLVWVDARLVGTSQGGAALDLDGASLSFIGQATIANGTTFEGTIVGGLSALTYDPSSDQFLALSDDRSQLSDARFYSLTIDLSDGVLDQNDVELRKVVTLRNAAGVPYGAASVDPEGIALARDGRLFISSEGDANQGLDPFVDRFAVIGQRVEALPVPYKFMAGLPNFGIRNNLAFESLTLTPDERTLFTATENALFQDGQAAQLRHGTPCRILSFDAATGAAGAEYVYWTNQIAALPVPMSSFATNGLVELLAANDHQLLALERSFSNGVGNAIKLFAVDLSVADDVSGVDVLENLLRSFAPVGKRMLLDLASLNLPLDNVEGMTFGPRLPDGRRSLILVSDDNFSPTQFTQFLAFAIDEL